MTDSHRLPRTVTPEAYRLHVSPDLDAGRFAGSVDIDVVVHLPTDDVVCHALGLDIDSVTIDSGSGPEVMTWRLDADTERLTVETPQLGAGRCTLSIAYHGTIGDGLVGFYRSTYRDGDEEHVVGVTQFEAPHARRAFPCWDEPEFKARFEVTITARSELFVVANGAEVSRRDAGDGHVEITFAETIPISTYLVAWVVGRLEATDPVVVRGIPVRVVHRPGRGHLTSMAIAAATHAVAWYEDHFDIPFPGGKLDMIAVPDFAFGAMENLGCITFREVLLLADETAVTPREREDIALVVAHEIAHMWFGDLVTMQWWDGIWLNEAFATHLELLCTDAFAPELEVWTNFGLGRAPAFDVDSVAATRPIHFPVETPEDAEGMFDVLTYEKGGSVLRMVERHVGETAWRDGTRRYLRAHLYGSTTANDLWAALGEASGVAVESILESWIEQGGHPAVSVVATDTGVTVSQQRYRPLGIDDTPDAEWQIPLTVVASVGGRVTTRQELLTGTTRDIDLGGRPEWVNVNGGGAGFYRSRYAPDLRLALAAQAASLTPLERFVLLDDVWAAMRSGHSTLDDVRSTLHAVTLDDVAVWRLAAEVLRVLDSLLAPSDDAARLVRSLVGEQWQAAASRATQSELSALWLRVAAVTGDDPRALTLAMSIANLVLDETPGGAPVPTAVVSTDVKSAVLEVAGAVGDASVHQRLWQRFVMARTPQGEIRALRAMAQTGDAQLQHQLLDRTLDDIRPQNAGSVVATCLRHPRLGGNAWRWVAEHWDALSDRLPAGAVPRMLAGISTLSDPVVAGEVTTFFADRSLPVGQQTMHQHLDLLRAHQALRATLRR